jgi:chromosome segregation ATPase
MSDASVETVADSGTDVPTSFDEAWEQDVADEETQEAAGFEDEMEEEDGPVDEASEKEGEEEKEEEKEEDEEEDLKPPPKKKQLSRYEKRVQSLNQRTKEAEAKAAEYEQKVQAAEQQQQQLAAQYQQAIQQQQYQQANQTEVQMAEMRKELELLRQAKDLQDEAGLSEVERFERKIQREAIEKAREELAPQLQQQQEQYEQLVQYMQQQQSEAQRNERIQGYDQDADLATKQLLEALPMDASAGLTEELKTHVLGWAATHNMLPKEAAADLDKFMHKYVLAKINATNKGNKARVARNRAVPPTNPTGRRSGKGKGRPSYDKIMASGQYEDMLDYMEKNS